MPSESESESGAKARALLALQYKIACTTEPITGSTGALRLLPERRRGLVLTTAW